jgi:hypothetical protein
LIFAVTFAILNKSKILGGKSGIDVIVAMVVGLLGLQQPFLREFFAQLFPRLGVGIGVLLALIILVGLFTLGHEGVFNIIFASIAFIIFLIVIISSQAGYSYMAWPWWQEYGNVIIWGVILIGIIVAFWVGGSKGKEEKAAHS